MKDDQEDVPIKGSFKALFSGLFKGDAKDAFDELKNAARDMFPVKEEGDRSVKEVFKDGVSSAKEALEKAGAWMQDVTPKVEKGFKKAKQSASDLGHEVAPKVKESLKSFKGKDEPEKETPRTEDSSSDSPDEPRQDA